MNAYELADKLDLEPYGIYGEQAANMLRQQADRIAHLEMLVADRNEIIDKLDLNPQTNAEPVAWMCPTGNNFISKKAPSYVKRGTDNWIPLYITPQNQLDRIAELEKEKGHIRVCPNSEVPTDCKISKDIITPFAYAVYVGENDRQNIFLQFDHPEMCGQKYNKVIPLYTTPQAKPLSDEEIVQIRQTTKADSTNNWADSLAFAKAIEERHGIK